MESAKEGRVNARVKVNSAKESNTRAEKLTETISATEDQTQSKVKLNVPPGFASETTQEAKAYLNPTRTETILPSRLQQHGAEIKLALAMPSREQAGQTDPRPIIEEPLSLPPMELKPLPSHLKYAYLDNEQQLPNIFSKSAKYNLFDPCKEMAYIPSEEDTKVKGKGTIDVVCNPLGKFGGALIKQFMILSFGSLANSTPYLGGVLLLIVVA
ncbi:hypothetical protein CR513_33631, partial [Mucuna pruriens]